MLWNDPWLSDPQHYPPPPAPTLPPGIVFRVSCVTDMSDSLIDAWRSLVQTKWDRIALRQRLDGAQIAMLLQDNNLIATCVLRPRAANVWLLETFVARPPGKGYGTLLVRHAVPWVWKRGCQSLVYTWELTVAGLAVAWWRGWLCTAVAYEWGWVWRDTSGTECGFCGDSKPVVGPPQFIRPMLFRNPEGDGYAVVSDSGLRDGWGYVLVTNGGVNWKNIIQKGGWKALWYRGNKPPHGQWRWTGEVVVVGVIGKSIPAQALRTILITSEVAI